MICVDNIAVHFHNCEKLEIAYYYASEQLHIFGLYIYTRIATWLSPCLLLVLTLCLDEVFHPPALVGGI